MSTRVRSGSWDRSACVSRVVSVLDRVVVVVAGLYLGVALIAGIRSLNTGDLAYLAGFGAVMGLMGAVCLACFREVGPDLYVRSAVTCAVGMLVVAGLLPLGWFYADVGFVMLLAGSALFVARRRQGRTRVAPSPPRTVDAPVGVMVAPEPRPVVPLDAVELSIDDTMTDLDLCQAWRSSYVALARARSAASRGRIVLAREVVLDELERRHPSAVRAWLESGARAAGGPERFVLGDDQGKHAVG